jgi:SET domain-containing protein
LFTLKNIKKDEIVCEYAGERITWADATDRNDEGKGGYVFYISDSRCVDAWAYTKTYGRYANDAAGMARIEGKRNNSIYEVIRGKVYIRATRNIPAGSEIFVSYGRSYWNIMRQEIAEKKAASRKRKK